ncbi:hypothetical protein Xtri_02840 [Xanthomonas campestris pv. trichodesmae]|uniref:Bacteriophage tail tape measure N-terminal domain-containing protein n=2 Tax=Xanthomonas citri TaxID=346 RepID=A0AB33C8W2_XANCI|nr:hypothetical protein XcvCFBP7111P_05635 [Xanthomonas citri pv. vignicola]MBZ3921796.1 hypothetical protein [Xanthomonas campestris pv. trichodesmae]MBZ3926396.1 hypothetical protein [Xanthomonas citri pv. sesbaniae]
MRITADLAQAQQELPKLDQALDAIEQSGKAGAKGLDAIEQSSKDAADALDRTSKRADNAADALERTGKGGAAGAKGLDTTQAAAGSAATALDRTGKEAEQASTALGKVGSEAASSAAQIQQAGSTTQKVAGEATTAIDREAAALKRQNDIRDRLTTLLNTQRGMRIQEADGQRQATTATGQLGAAMKSSALSAGEYRQAMRTLPAQITDIVTSIAGGQSIFMVAIQQGGQLKDQWGGIGPAASALVGAINPVTVAVAAGTAALAGIAISAYQGAEEIRDLQATLLLAGRDAGNMSGKVLDAADALGKLPGATTSGAIAALESVAATGHYTADEITLIGTAAEKMRLATGRAITDTVAEFEALRKDPVAAILELNDKYNFLTQAQLTNIEALKEQGNQQAAVSAAFAAFAGMINDRTPRIVENAGWIEKAWRNIRNEVMATVDAARDLGRDPGIEQQIKALQQRSRTPVTRSPAAAAPRPKPTCAAWSSSWPQCAGARSRSRWLASTHRWTRPSPSRVRPRLKASIKAWIRALRKRKS